MSVNKLAAKLVSELYKKPIIDDNAETTLELSEAWRLPERTTYNIVRKLLDSGQIERVWKRIPGHRKLMPAYRVRRG